MQNPKGKGLDLETAAKRYAALGTSLEGYRKAIEFFVNAGGTNAHSSNLEKRYPLEYRGFEPFAEDPRPTRIAPWEDYPDYHFIPIINDGREGKKAFVTFESIPDDLSESEALPQSSESALKAPIGPEAGAVGTSSLVTEFISDPLTFDPASIASTPAAERPSVLEAFLAERFKELHAQGHPAAADDSEQGASDICNSSVASEYTEFPVLLWGLCMGFHNRDYQDMDRIEMAEGEKSDDVFKEGIAMQTVLMVLKARLNRPILINKKNLEHTLLITKRLLNLAWKDREVRYVGGLGKLQDEYQPSFWSFANFIPFSSQSLGLSFDLWLNFEESIDAATSALTRQSIRPEGQSVEELSELYTNILWVKDVCIINRHMLVMNRRAQNLAAQSSYTYMLLTLIQLCVKVLSRGDFVGKLTPEAEEKWHLIIAEYKKLLVICLQVLNNSVVNNERRLLLLWLELFSKSDSVDEDFIPSHAMRYLEAEYEPEIVAAIFTKLGIEDEEGDKEDGLDPEKAEKAKMEIPSLGAPRGFIASRRMQYYGSEEEWAARRDNAESEDLRKYTPTAASKHLQTFYNRLLTEMIEKDPEFQAISKAPDGTLDGPSSGPSKERTEERDYGSSGPEFEGSTAPPESSQEDDESNYADGGVLTEVALHLSPGQMDALMVMINAGVREQTGHVRDENAPSLGEVRCNMLLAYKNGRNLLRELLIFMAVWPIEEEHMYFKLLMNIINSILDNGLVPFAYDALAHPKEIISVPQTQLVNLLTHIYEAPYKSGAGSYKQRTTVPKETAPTSTESPALAVNSTAPSQPPAILVRFLFRTFRITVASHIGAILALQHQSRSGVFSTKPIDSAITATAADPTSDSLPDNFPITWWDMERLHDGLTAYLAFFESLARITAWKDLLLECDIVYEICVLLKGLVTLDFPGRAAVDEKRAHEKVVAHHNAPVPNTSSTSQQSSSRASSPPQPTAPHHAAFFPWPKTKSALLSLLAFMVERSADAQDKARQWGGVEAVMWCAARGNRVGTGGYEDGEDYLREYAIVAVRKLCEGNPRNTEMVRGGLGAKGDWSGEREKEVG